jgi:hypothetical protein
MSFRAESEAERPGEPMCAAGKKGWFEILNAWHLTFPSFALSIDRLDATPLHCYLRYVTPPPHPAAAVPEGNGGKVGSRGQQHDDEHEVAHASNMSIPAIPRATRTTRCTASATCHALPRLRR